MHSGAAYIISNICLTVMWFTSACIVLENRFSYVKTILSECAIQFMLWAVAEKTVAVFSPIRSIVGFGLPILLIILFHADNLGFKLMTGLLVVISNIAAEFIAGAFLPYDMVISGELFKRWDVAIYSFYILLNFVLLSIVIVALRALKHHYKGLLVEKQWFLFLLFPLSQAIAMCGWWPSYLQYYTFGNPYIVLALTVLNLLADVALIYTIRQTASNTEIRISNRFLNEQIRSQEHYYEQLASTYSNIRKMRHDIDNHIYAVEGLLKSNEIHKASEYLQSIRETVSTGTEFDDCNNTVVSSFLSRKKEILTEEGIILQTDLHIPHLIDISNPDLICIYGNLLDNAEEACKGFSHPVIRLKTYYKEPYLVISVVNPAKDIAENKAKRILELERGIGFTILSNIAREHDGEFQSRNDNGKFYTELILKAQTGD